MRSMVDHGSERVSRPPPPPPPPRPLPLPRNGLRPPPYGSQWALSMCGAYCIYSRDRRLVPLLRVGIWKRLNLQTCRSCRKLVALRKMSIASRGGPIERGISAAFCLGGALAPAHEFRAGQPNFVPPASDNNKDTNHQQNGPLIVSIPLCQFIAVVLIHPASPPRMTSLSPSRCSRSRRPTRRPATLRPLS